MNSTFNYLDAFKAHNRADIKNVGKVIFNPLDAGLLYLPSGKLFACDPLVIGASPSFDAEFPQKSCYPVTLSIAQVLDRKMSPRVAYAMVQFTQTQPLKWKLANFLGYDLSSLQEGEFFGYGVDSATGCFIDYEASFLLDDMTYMEEPKSLLDELSDILEDIQSFSVAWANLCIDKHTHANVVAFQTGWGDGVYASFFGYDVENNIACVVTDCQLFDTKKMTWL